MSGSFTQRGELDIADGLLILATGKKKSGKSILGKVLFLSYPGDKIVIDVAGDDGPTQDVIELRGTVQDLPRRWPEEQREHPDQYLTLRYVPDLGSPTVLEDIDVVVGLALSHGRDQHHRGRRGCCVLIHEIGKVAPAGRTKPHMARALGQNRHYNTTVIMCGPRPQTIDPLALQQCDLVYIFEILNPADRARLAETIGWDPKDLDAAIEDLGRHEYLRFDCNEEKPDPGEEDIRLIHFPALPQDLVDQAQAA